MSLNLIKKMEGNVKKKSTLAVKPKKGKRVSDVN